MLRQTGHSSCTGSAVHCCICKDYMQAQDKCSAWLLKYVQESHCLYVLLHSKLNNTWLPGFAAHMKALTVKCFGYTKFRMLKICLSQNKISKTKPLKFCHKSKVKMDSVTVYPILPKCRWGLRKIMWQLISM